MIYHIIDAKDCGAPASSGMYRPASLDTEGFIHCSAGEAETLAVANSFYRGRDIRALAIDETALGDSLKWEKPTHDMFRGLFPHVYGEIPASAVAGIHDFIVDENGLFIGIV